MSEYTASNGIRVENFTHFSGLQRIVVEKNGNREIDVAVTGDVVEALVEALDHERDEDFGRWRWPENEHYVVYPPDERGEARVLRETDGTSYEWTRESSSNSSLTGGAAMAARAYFEAHPERKTWEDAKPGEHWELTAEGGTREYVAILSNGKSGEYVRFFPIADLHAVTLGVGATVITSGRRIWPEGDAS